MGERVTCSLLRGAGEVFGHGYDYWSQYERCPAFAPDAVLPHGSDTQVPSTTLPAAPETP
jgi:hypothetical protein